MVGNEDLPIADYTLGFFDNLGYPVPNQDGSRKLVKKVKVLEDKLKGRKRIKFVGMTCSDNEGGCEQLWIHLIQAEVISTSSSVPTDEFAGGSNVLVGATTGPSADPSNKEEQAELDKEREEMQKKRQQDVLNSAKYYTDSDWSDIMSQVHANQGLTADLLGPYVTEDNFAERMVALIAKRRRDFEHREGPFSEANHRGCEVLLNCSTTQHTGSSVRRLYMKEAVLETVGGLVANIFCRLRKYPLSVKLIDMVCLIICWKFVRNSGVMKFTTAVQLIVFLKKQIDDSRHPKVHDCPCLDADFLVADSKFMKVAFGVGFKMLLFNPLVFSMKDLSRNLKLTVSNSSLGEDFPTGKDNVIVSTGRTKVIPAGRTKVIPGSIMLTTS
ncbi:hypothetical protein Tco_0770948 [Tanacetum coccineum]|uniref:Uncharacterized protein n=1 Tax=Tanacetum coccineum TaxID=301880 RepID=A0ABQ4ZGJ1_9ASTR